MASTGGKRRGIVEALLRKGAPLQEKNKEFLTPLHVCADKGHCDIMELLLKHGSKVNALDGLGQTGEDDTLLMYNLPEGKDLNFNGKIISVVIKAT